MAKQSYRRRTVSEEELFFGSEPNPIDHQIENDFDMIKALNWYNYTQTSEKAKEWLMKTLPDRKKAISPIPDWELRTIGWVYRMITQGFQIPVNTMENIEKKLTALIEKYAENDDAPTKAKVNPQIFIQQKKQQHLENMETIVDEEMRGHLKNFDPYKWMVEQQVSSAAAKEIAEYYEKWQPQRPFIKSIVDAANSVMVNAKATRKPRAKKTKSVDAILKDFQYRKQDVEMKLISISPTELLKATEAWIFDTEKRKLTVFRGNLSVRGKSIVGFDEKLSETKILRKPTEVLPDLLKATKAGMKKIMNGVKTKPSVTTGRTNEETILLRAFK